MTTRAPARFALAIAALSLSASPVAAQLALSANDGKQPLLNEKPSSVVPDTVAVIDLDQSPPRVVGTVAVPVSMIGPPTSVAVARDESFAVVTAAQKLDPADPTKFVLDDTVSLVDLADPARPVVRQTLKAGAGASGVALNRSGTLALVAATGEGTISIFSIAKKTMTPAGKLQLDAALGPVDVNLSPDGRTALVTQRRGDGIWRLAVDGTSVTDTGVFYATGGQPYGSVFSPDGRFAYNNNLGGRPRPPAAAEPGPRVGTVTAIDLATNRVVTTVDVGNTPEHVALSPDGRYLEVNLINGSTADPTSPAYNSFGLMKVFRVDGPSLTLVAETRTGAWGQGATWSKDGRLILLQSATDKTVEVYRFDGTTLTRDHAATITFATRPGTIVTALSR